MDFVLIFDISSLDVCRNGGFHLAQLVKFFIVEYEIRGSILTYIKNWLVSWSDVNQEWLSYIETISKKKKKKDVCGNVQMNYYYF